MPKLKGLLSQIWPSLKGTFTEWKDVVLKVRVPDGKKALHVKDVCSNNSVKNIFRTTTIHSVKGETLNAVLLISHWNKKSTGGHFSDWLMEQGFEPEHLRFAYVAASRPQFALILATPKLTAKELKKLEALGFQLEQ